VIHSILAAILHLTQIEFMEPQSANDTLIVKDHQPLNKSKLHYITVIYFKGIVKCHRSNLLLQFCQIY